MDLISPWCGVSSFNAPQPARVAPFQIVQKVISALRRPSRFSAWRLSGGETCSMQRRCSCSRAIISGPRRSSTRICIVALFVRVLLIRRFLFVQFALQQPEADAEGDEGGEEDASEEQVGEVKALRSF